MPKQEGEKVKYYQRNVNNYVLCIFFLMTSACFKEVNKVTGSIGPQSMRRDVTKGKRRLR